MYNLDEKGKVFKMNIGEKIYELRKSKKLSQEEVAEKLNVTRQTVSKWETNQSTPDFDKIVPLCELFEISTDELLKGEKKEEITEEHKVNNLEEKIMSKEEVKRKRAEVISTSVFTYIVAVALFILAIELVDINEIVIVSIFLCVIAWPTARIIKHFISSPKFEETREEKKEKMIIKEINSIIGVVSTIIYFLVSFTTMSWHISWIIFIIGGLICEIVKLIFLLKEEYNEK